MKTLILTAILASANLAHASEFQEQVSCLLPNQGAVKALLLESGFTKYFPDQPPVHTQGTLTLLGENGPLEKVTPSTGTGGIFNEYNFPGSFTYENDAQRAQVLRFETKQLGELLIASICNRPNAYACEDRSGNMVNTARVAINLNGKIVLNFNGQSLPFCERRVLK